VVLRAFGLSDSGSSRPTNEDRFAIDEDLGLCVIADGMGGHKAGAIASQLAVNAIVEVVRQGNAHCPGAVPGRSGYDRSLSADGNLLRTAVQVASLQVVEAAGAVAAYAGMGTTIVAARVSHGRLSVAHAGDSRLYVLGGGRLTQITADDSWIASVLADDPDADLDALERHPMRSALTNVVGGNAATEVHVAERRLEGGERLLLSTDGVHGVVDDSQLACLLQRDGEPRTIALQVIRAALALGSRDDCTAIVAEYSNRRV
jgi:PPM family protein phosphatase